MGVASLNGKLFRLDPVSVQWTYKIKTAVYETIGGRVVQIIGVMFGDMTLTGSFGVGGWQEQETFLTNMRAMADAQVATNFTVVNRHLSSPPVRFLYPPKNWDFLVYLRDFIQPGGEGPSVTLANEIINPKWLLNLAIVEANSSFSTLGAAAANDYITRLSQGLGWASTAELRSYQGTISQQDVVTLLQHQQIDPNDPLAAAKYLQTFTLGGPAGNAVGATSP
jgi:hypothetical protein